MGHKITRNTFSALQAEQLLIFYRDFSRNLSRSETINTTLKIGLEAALQITGGVAGCAFSHLDCSDGFEPVHRIGFADAPVRISDPASGAPELLKAASAGEIVCLSGADPACLLPVPDRDSLVVISPVLIGNCLSACLAIVLPGAEPLADDLRLALETISAEVECALGRLSALEARHERDDHLHAFAEGVRYAITLHEVIRDDDGEPVDFRYLWVNQVFARDVGVQPLSLIGRRLVDAIPSASSHWFPVFQQAARSDEPLQIVASSPNGRKFYEINFFKVDNRRLVVSYHDVTDKQRTKEKWRASRDAYRAIFEAVNDAISIHDAETGDVIEMNRAARKLYGFSQRTARLNGHPIPHLDQFCTEDFRALVRRAANGQPQKIECRVLRHDGEWFWADVSLRRAQIAGYKRVLIVVRDITEHKQSEERTQASEGRYRLISESVSDMAYALKVFESGKIEVEWVTDSFVRNTGYTAEEYEEMLCGGGQHYRFVHPDDQAIIQERWQRWMAGESTETDYRLVTKSGQVRWVRSYSKSEVTTPGRLPMRVVGAIQDITERKLVTDDLRRQVERMSALRVIDMAIAANRHIGAILNVFLSQVCSTLHVDAAEIMMYDSLTGTLRHLTGIGLPAGLELANLQLGQGLSGLAASQRRLIFSEDIRQDERVAREEVMREGFVSAAAVPLIMHGGIKGVLNIMHRNPIEQDAGWEEFVYSLASQAALAIDNAELMEGLRMSNEELALAYDSTIEGWSKALEYRDRETEGHSDRVTHMAVRLAERLGIKGDDLVHLRRGALLHDIGKMGIPDGILLKPGPLTAEEWAVMARHPSYAYEWLKPIRFLQPALDIPYCHHEKWDGTGYPRGLKGTQIPLAARIFAVIDVWDALSSDRPYRKAWGEDQVMEHLRSQSGSHFDPHVIDKFIELLSERK